MASLMDTPVLDLTAEVEAFMGTNPAAHPPAGLHDRFRWLVEFQRRLHEAGLAVVSWPECYGGRGCSPFDAITVARALGRARAPELINFVATEVVAPALLAFAAPAQLERWLRPMASADEVWCQLFSEPDAGSDLASLRTRATADGDVWRVTGSKVWSTWAQFADKGLLLARTGPLETRHRTIGAFVIDMHQPGIEVRPLVTMTGAAEFAEVTFDGAVARPEDVVGNVDEGWKVAMRMLDNERGPYAMRRVAVLGSGLAQLKEEARRRGVGPKVREQVVDAEIAMWLLERRATEVAARLADDEPLGLASTLTKVALTNAEQTIFAAAHALLGPDGIAWFDEPEEVEKFLYSRSASIYGGSAQIQRNVLAERYLGLPPEPRP